MWEVNARHVRRFEKNLRRLHICFLQSIPSFSPHCCFRNKMFASVVFLLVATFLVAQGFRFYNGLSTVR